MVDHVVVGTGGVGTRFLSKNYPITEGLTAGTTKQEGTKERLEYEQTFIPSRNKALID